MKQKDFNKVILIALSSILMIGCAKDGGGPAVEEQEVPGSTKVVASEDGSVRLIKYIPTLQETTEQRAKYFQSDLVQMPSVEMEHTFSIFRLNNVTDYDGSVFLAPKVFVYSGAEGARMSPKVNSNGTVSMDFPLVLTSGLSKRVIAPNGKDEVDLPNSHYIQDKEGFLKTLQAIKAYKNLGVDNVAVLPGCPKQVVIQVGSREYDATPSDFRKGDYCQTESVFTASVTMTERDARHFLENDLYNSVASIRVLFETKANITKSKFEIEFDKQKVFESLKVKLDLNTPYVSGSVRSEVTKVMQSHIAKINMVGEILDQMDHIVDRAMSLFFEKMLPNATHPKFKKCQSTGCVNLSYNYLKDSQGFRLTWLRSSNEQTGQYYLTSARLHPLDDEVQLGTKMMVSSNGKNREYKVLKNGASVETGLTVEANDLLVIKPSGVVVDEVRPSGKSRGRVNNSVCVEKSIRHSRMKNVDGPVGEYEVCVKTENQWVETFVHGLEAQNSIYQVNPVGKFEQLYEGIEFKFTWTLDNGVVKKVHCPLHLFQREGDGRALTIRLNNQAGCQIFQKYSKRPMLHIVNRIEFNRHYKHGTVTKYWNGKVISNLKDGVYSPKVHFQGSLTIKGYSFKTERNRSYNLKRYQKVPSPFW